MISETGPWTCEECGKETDAVHIVWDYIEHENNERGIVEHHNQQPPHLFCPEHKRESECLGGTTDLYRLFAGAMDE